MNLYLIIFIVAILSYFYLLYEINKNNYTIVFIYFIFLNILELVWEAQIL